MRWLILSLALLLGMSQARAEPITVYNTGVDSGGTVLIDGTVPDPHYILFVDPSSSGDSRVRTSTGGFAIPPWVADSAISAWIGPNSQGPAGHEHDLTGPVGDYDYRTTFTLVSAGVVHLTGRWSTDNGGVDILLNGTSTGNTIAYGTDPSGPYSFDHWTDFAVTALGHAGSNTLDFIVNNHSSTGDDNPTGLRVEFDLLHSSADPIPEPFSMAFLASAFVGVVAVRLRGRRKEANRK